VEVATIESVMAGARKYMRDFPRYFTASVGVVGTPRLLKLPHPNVVPQELSVEAIGPTSYCTGLLALTGVSSAEGVFVYTLDVREGLIKILNPPTNGWGDATNFNMDGYYFPWVSPGDMQFYAEVLITEHGTQRPEFDLDEVSDAEEDLMQLGTAIVHAQQHTGEGRNGPAGRRTAHGDAEPGEKRFTGNGELQKMLPI